MTGAALVIGANGGIGNALCAALVRAGYPVVATGRNGEALEALARRLSTEGGPCRALTLDITDDEAVDRAVADVASRSEGGLAVAVNNAGQAHRPAPLHELPVAELDRVMGVTFRGVALAMRAELAAMVAGGRGGAVVNIVSTAAFTGPPGMSAYAAAKHAVVGLTRCASVDYGSHDIRVNAVAPGATRSGNWVGQVPPERLAQATNRIPIGRLTEPDDVAAAALSLITNRSANGVVLPVHGGALL